MLNAAVAAEVGGLTKSPLEIRLGNAGNRRRSDDEVPTLVEVNKLIAAMPPELQLAVKLAAWCQLRMGEVLGLQRQDFRNLDKSGKATLHIARQWLSKASPPAYGPPKDGSERTVAIPRKLAQDASRHLEKFVGDEPHSPVFPSPKDKTRPISHNAFASRWNAARDKVRPGTNFHTLRHFGLSMYAQAGATTTEVMRRGGHKDIDAAMRYQHSNLERDRQLAAKLNLLIEGGTE
jgi:integrase